MIPFVATTSLYFPCKAARFLQRLAVKQLVFRAVLSVLNDFFYISIGMVLLEMRIAASIIERM
jgi:hypothetical protein